MLEKINLASIWTMLTGTALVIAYAFNTFATASEVKSQIIPLKLAVWYGQYYDRLDDFDEAVAEGNENLAKEYARQMEKLKAQICEEDPEWERC